MKGINDAYRIQRKRIEDAAARKKKDDDDATAALKKKDDEAARKKKLLLSEATLIRAEIVKAVSGCHEIIIARTVSCFV